MHDTACKAFRAFMKATGKKQVGLAEYIGITQKSVNKYLNHKDANPASPELVKIKVAFPVLSLEDIIYIGD